MWNSGVWGSGILPSLLFPDFVNWVLLLFCTMVHGRASTGGGEEPLWCSLPLMPSANAYFCKVVNPGLLPPPLETWYVGYKELPRARKKQVAGVPCVGARGWPVQETEETALSGSPTSWLDSASSSESLSPPKSSPFPPGSEQLLWLPP